MAFRIFHFPTAEPFQALNHLNYDHSHPWGHRFHFRLLDRPCSQLMERPGPLLSHWAVPLPRFWASLLLFRRPGTPTTGTTEAYRAEVSFACLPEGTRVSFSPDIRPQEGPRGKPCTLSDSQVQHLTLSGLLRPQDSRLAEASMPSAGSRPGGTNFSFL